MYYMCVTVRDKMSVIKASKGGWKPCCFNDVMDTYDYTLYISTCVHNSFNKLHIHLYLCNCIWTFLHTMFNIKMSNLFANSL